MKQRTRPFLAVLAGSILTCAIGAFAAEPETITVAGTEYRVIPDKEFRDLGFEFPDVPRNENAAYDYIAAINAYEPIEDRELQRLARRRVIWDDAPPELREYVRGNQEALDLVRAGTRKSLCRFPFLDTSRSGHDVPIIYRAFLPPCYSWSRHLAMFLGLAGSMREHDGDYAECLALYADAAAIGVHVEQDGSLIGSLSACACTGIGLWHIRGCVLGAKIDDADLREVQKRLARVRARRPDCLDTIRWERVFSTHVIGYAFEEQQRPSLHVDIRSWPDAFVAFLLSSPRLQAAMRAGDERFWDALTRLARKPLPDYIRATTRYLESTPEQLRAFLVGLPGVDALWCLTERGSVIKYRTMYDRESLEWTVTDAFLALARFKAQHGEYPEKLEDAKDLMLSDGVDPFSGELLKYRREDDGSFTLWSVGDNLVDDGGKADEGGNRWEGPDYVWSSRVESDAE